uniref:Uncharacterized protein n=1 Tax=Anopheles arabiensis TaxID=7173 RepID=A0A182HRR7_ANOAR
MHVFDNIHVLLRSLRFLGLISVQKCQCSDHRSGSNPFKSTNNAAPKFMILFALSLLTSGHSIFRGTIDNSVIDTLDQGTIWPFVYLVHQITLCVALCALPWQTFWERKRLSAAMNILAQNEINLIARTGVRTDYRIVSWLAIAIVCNGMCLHLFFQVFYIVQYGGMDKPFLPLYITSCAFMYVDLAMELVLGLCDCLLLIVRLQLQRLVCSAQNLGRSGDKEDDFLTFYGTMYCKIAVVLSDHLGPYFGLIILMHCSYVCFEAAICILDMYDLLLNNNSSGLLYLVYIIWPLSDIKKVMILFMLSEQVNRLLNMFENIHALLRSLQWVGQLSIQNHAEEDGLFRSTRHATAKFTLSFIVSMVASSHLIYRGVKDYDQLSVDGIIWPLIYVVHYAMLCTVLCSLPLQTFRQRDRLAAALNTLHQNELSLIDLTGSVTDYRVVKLLVFVILSNGVIFHVFFHAYYIIKNTGSDTYFLVYMVSCTFMYFDLVIELVLGLCDCLLLIAHLQLERLVWIVKNRDQAAMSIDRVLLTYVSMYNNITNVLRNNLTPYFGPIILLHSSYVCLEAAVCILDVNSYLARKNRPSMMVILANILWPLSDVKKLAAIFLLGEGVNGMCAQVLQYKHMDVFDNIRGLIRCLRILGLFSIHQYRHTGNTFECSRHAALKFVIFLTITLACSGYSMYRNIIDYPAMAAMSNTTIEPFFYIAHTITVCVVLCVLPVQTVGRRHQLAYFMNILVKNEEDLVKLTSGGRSTNYRLVTLLATVCLWNGLLFHVFFHFYYIDEFRHFGDRFVSMYIVSCFFMYIDLAMELLLGLCGCLLLVAQLQLGRLAQAAREFDYGVDSPERFFFRYGVIHNRTAFAIRNHLSHYFGPMLAVFCTYVSLEVAICLLAIVNSMTNPMGQSKLYIVVVVLWPLTDVKKLFAVILLSERTKQVWVQTILNNLSTFGVALARYEGEQCSYRRPTTHQCVTHFLLVLFSIGFLLYCIWEQYSIFAMAIYAFDDATFILSTASFIVAWFVVPLVSCARGDRLIYTLNNLLENDTDLSRLHAIQSSVRLSYRQAKWFGRMMQYESIACCLLLSAGYTILYSFQPEAWYLYLTIGIYLYEDLCLSWLFGFYSTIMMHYVDQLSYAAQLLQEDHAHTLDERVRVFCKTYERVSRAVARSFFEYTGPVIATFCTLVMFEGSLKLYHVYDVFIRGVNEIVWTEHMLNVIECLWLCFDVKKLFIVMYISGMLQQKLLYSLCCITFTSFRVWVQFSVHSQIEHEMLENISFIVSTASFCIIWMVVPLYAYARCSRLVHALNSLQANDAELGHVITLSYRRVKCFACFIQLDGVLCCLLLSTGYTIAFWYQGQPWYMFLNIGIYIYEDLCLSWLFGIYSAIMLFCVAQLSCAAKLLQSDYYHSDTLETRLRLFCRTYDRVCTRVAQPFYEYCGPVVATFCPLLIFEGSLKLFHAYDVFKRSTYRTVWTEQLLSASEWLWLSFDVKKLFVVLYVSEVLKQKCMEKLGLTMVKYDPGKHTFISVPYAPLKFACLFTAALVSSGYLLWRSPLDYIVYKLDTRMFDITIFIINTTISCTLCLILPLQCYYKNRQLSSSLNALLKNDSILRQAILEMGGKPLCYKEATLFSRIMRWDGIVCVSFFFCSYFIKSWSKCNFVHIQLSVCIYLATDLALDWTLGLCCVMILVGIAQLSHIVDLLKIASTRRTIAFEQIWLPLWQVYDRVTIDVRKDLSQYCGPIVVFSSCMIGMESAVKMVDVGGALNDGSGDITILILGCLWLLFNIKKLIALLLLSEHLKQKYVAVPHSERTMAASSFAELIRPMINTACTLGVSYVKQCPSTSDRFVISKSPTIKFGFWIVILLAMGCYLLIRTKQDVLERSQKESYFDYALFFVSNLMLVLSVLQMVYYGYTRKHVQLELLNSTIDIERELTVFLKRKINYGVIARFTKWLTIWTIFFYVIIMHTLYVFDHLRYNTFILMYIETLLLLYANNCIEFTIIICSTTQMTLCRYLKDLMNTLEAKKLPLASEFYMYFKLIDRITVLINFHLSQIYGSFVVFHCMYVLFESASIWFSFLSASSSMQFQIVNEESNLMLVSYILWLVSDSKNVLLVAISSSLLQQKVINT